MAFTSLFPEQPPSLYAILSADLLTVEALCTERELEGISLQPYAIPVSQAFDPHCMVPQVVQVAPGRYEVVTLAGACACGQFVYTMPRDPAAGATFLGDAHAAHLTAADYPTEQLYPDLQIDLCTRCRRRPRIVQRNKAHMLALSARLYAREGAKD